MGLASFNAARRRAAEEAARKAEQDRLKNAKTSDDAKVSEVIDSIEWPSKKAAAEAKKLLFDQLDADPLKVRDDKGEEHGVEAFEFVSEMLKKGVSLAEVQAAIQPKKPEPGEK